MYVVMSVFGDVYVFNHPSGIENTSLEMRIYN